MNKILSLMKLQIFFNPRAWGENRHASAGRLLLQLMVLASTLVLSACGLFGTIKSFDPEADCRQQFIYGTPDRWLSKFVTEKRTQGSRVDVYISATAKEGIVDFHPTIDHFHCVYNSGQSVASDRQLPPPVTQQVAPPVQVPQVQTTPSSGKMVKEAESIEDKKAETPHTSPKKPDEAQ